MDFPQKSLEAIHHPEIVAIAIDITLHPARRPYYTPLVLSLADAAIEHLSQTLLTRKTAAGPGSA